MTTQIESFYHLRKKYRGGHVFGLGIFIIAWIAYSIYRFIKLNTENLLWAIFIVLVLSLVYLAYNAIRFNIVERQIKSNPALKEALHDELFQLNELKAWKTAFFSVIGFTVLSAISSLFIDIEDIMLIFITTLLIGFGSYSFTLYILER